MINRKWFLSGLLVINFSLALVIFTDWRAQEAVQQRQERSKDLELAGQKIRLIGSAAEQQLLQRPEPAESVILEPEVALGQTSGQLSSNGSSGVDGSKTCLAFGPFSASELEQLQSTTDTLGIIRWVESMSVGSSESQLRLAIGGYRVFVPPRDSLEEAYDLLQLFRAQGFDSYVMTQGIYARGISLGVFSSDLAVQSLIDQLGQTLRSYAEVVDVSPMQGDFMLQASAQTAAHGLVRWVQAKAEELTMPLPSVTPEAFRVFVPPSGSLEQAYKLRKVFRKKGFDSYVMTQGLQAGGISLGVFSSENAALRLLDQLDPDLKRRVEVGDASSGQSQFMLQALSLTAAQLSLLRSVLPNGIEAEGKVCSVSASTSVN